MKDKTARITAIVALIFMAVFVVSLTLSLAGVVRYVFTYVAIGSAAVTLALFVLIKMSGRGYSITQMNNEIEMEKIQKEIDSLRAQEQAEKADEAEKSEKAEVRQTETADASGDDRDAESSAASRK